ncbi:MAG: hypothetical protein RR461_02445 [Angelakisella sp.]
MENNNLTPENEQQPDTLGTPEQSDTLGTPEQSQVPEIPQEAGNSTSSPSPIPTEPVKRKYGLMAGVAAAILVIVAVAGYAVLGQSPQKVVLKAMESGYARSLKQSEQLMSDLPVLAKTQELAKSGSETKLELKLNSMEMPGLPPMAAMFVNGSSISGTTKANPATSSFENSYSLTMLGKKLVTLNLFNTPTVMSVGVPEFFAKNYYLDMDKMVTEGTNSYLFTELLPANQEDLQAFADGYKGMMQSSKAMTTEELTAMGKKMSEIFTANLVNAQFATTKVEGQKLYTVTIAPEDVTALMSSLVNYIYLESPIGLRMSGMMSSIEGEDYASTIQTINTEMANMLPTSPTVVTLKIDKVIINNVDIHTEGTNAAQMPVNFSMVIENPESLTAKVTMHLNVGEGAEKVVMDMTADSTYANKALDVMVNMDMVTGEASDGLSMVLGYKMDGNQQTDNMGMSLDYIIRVPSEGMEIGIKMDALGDYYLQEDTVVLSMDDIGYTVTTGDMAINMGLGLQMSTAPFAEQLIMPESVDALTLTQNDIIALSTEVDAAMNKLMSLFLGNIM